MLNSLIKVAVKQFTTAAALDRTKMISGTSILLLLIASVTCLETTVTLGDSLPFNEIVDLIENDVSIDMSSPSLILKRMADEIIARVPGAAIVRPTREVDPLNSNDGAVSSSFSHDIPGGKHEQMTMIVNGEVEVIGNYSYTDEETGVTRMTTYMTNKNGTKSRTSFQIRQRRKADLTKSLLG